MADGGAPVNPDNGVSEDPNFKQSDTNEPGLKDASVSDFLLPYLLGPSAMKTGADMAEGVGAKLADEAGEVSLGGSRGLPSAADRLDFSDLARNSYKTLGGETKQALQNAPKMEEAAEASAPKFEAFIKGIQKNPNGADIKIWGVKGKPADLLKEFGDEAPGSVPEHILRSKGILPEKVSIPQEAPNRYAEGGIVDKIKSDKTEAQKADDIDPVVTSTDTPKTYNEGGFPHVTFMEDQMPNEVKKTVHLAKEPTKMATGGEVPDKKLVAIYKAMGIKKYADGGEVDASQLPDPNAAPNPSDPSYWDKIKAALGQVTAPITGAANAITAPLQSATNAAMPLVPPVVSAVNKLTGANLPVPATQAEPAPAMMDTVAPPAVVPPVAQKPVLAPTPISHAAPQPSELGNLFNQDTSKLTQGVNAEDRNALVDKLGAQQHGLGAVIAQAVAGLGDALAAKGGREQHSLQGIFSMQKQQRDEALSNFDKARQDRIQKLALQTQMGNNSIQKLAAQDAYGTDEHLNKMLGAPAGTAHKDLPLYFQMKSAEVAQQEKDADLYMKSHAQAASEVDAAVKNSSMLNIKPSPAQLEASGAKLADQYYNKAKGNILVKPSDGGPAQWIPAKNIGQARQMDTNLQVMK